MITEIGIYSHIHQGDYIQPSPYGCDPEAWVKYPHWKPDRVIVNNKYRLELEYLELNDKVFEARIVAGPPDLLNVKTSVDWKVLHEACLTGHNIINTGPLLIGGNFIWKIKGSVKLCSA